MQKILCRRNVGFTMEIRMEIRIYNGDTIRYNYIMLNNKNFLRIV